MRGGQPTHTKAASFSWLEFLQHVYSVHTRAETFNASGEFIMPAVVYVHTPATALLVGRLLLAEQCPLGGVAPAGEQRLRPPRIELRAEC